MIRQSTSRQGSRGRRGLRDAVPAWVSLGAAALCGCATADPAGPPPGPPGAWVQRSTPLSPAPIEFDRQTGAPPPVLDLQTTAPLELTVPAGGPDVPAPEPAASAAPPFPPLAPPAEAGAAPAPPAAPPEPVVTQAMLDELSGQIASLNRRIDEQSAALDESRRQSEAARLATQHLQSEFTSWRAELDVVRDTIQAQGAADLQALDELNQAVEQLLNTPAPPAAAPESAEPEQMVNRRNSRGVRR